MITTKSETLELACQLIAKASITPDDHGCQELLAAMLSKAGFTCEHLRFGDVDNLWARIGSAEPLFVFAGHTDVVPTGPLDKWSSPPFVPTIHNDMLYGRGTSDMKVAVAAMTTAAINFVRSTPNFKGSIGFLLTSDEEGPSINGTKKVMEVLQERGIKIDYCVIGEPSSDKTTGDQIRIGRRGSLSGKLMIRGKQGHVAHPHLAVNPIHTSLAVLQALLKEVWDTGNKDFPATSFQISNIHAGTGALNVIPGEIEIDFNFRFSTAVSVDELKHRTHDIVKGHGLPFEISWIVGAEPFLTKQGKLISATVSAIQQVTNIHTNLSTGGGTSDGRFIAPTGAELIELGLINATAHHIDEHVRIDEIEKLRLMYEKILMGLLV